MSSIVMRPVNECTFLLLTMVFLFCCIMQVRRIGDLSGVS